jgi:hypothetical protein
VADLLGSTYGVTVYYKEKRGYRAKVVLGDCNHLYPGQYDDIYPFDDACRAVLSVPAEVLADEIIGWWDEKHTVIEG